MDTDKKSDVAIVKEINALNGSSVSVNTTSMMVRDGQIGVLHLRHGPSSIISRQIWNVLQSAFISYVKLEQAKFSKQSNMKNISLKVNKYLNKAEYMRKDQYFVKS